MGFLDQRYLLENDLACELYSSVENLPIIDAHNHGDVEEIVNNEGWSDIWEVEGKTDHYVWELMRRCGVEEEKITGSASHREKWLALAEIFPQLGGNPTYEWIHLDLKKRFGISEIISSTTGEKIWQQTSEILASERMTPRKLLKEMNVEIMCTTDDPDSGLEFHRQAQREIEDIKILPTWRPDKAMNINHKDWKKFVYRLTDAEDVDENSFSSFLEALEESHRFFDEMGCVSSDHGVLEPVIYPVNKKRAAVVYNKALAGEELTAGEIADFKSFMLLYFARLNEKKDWVMQLHIGAVRNYRDSLFKSLGPDSGGDIATNNLELVDNMKYFFNTFDDSLIIVLYYLDPVLEPTVATIVRAFPNVFLGAPWWFNDSSYGIDRHLQYVASVDLLSHHAGMVTDSRKLISYDSRTEVFRRTACNLLGRMVKKRQLPEGVAVNLARRIFYQSPFELFFKSRVD